MTNIATLGFDIDTAPIAKANTELNKLVANAGKAEKAVDSLGAKASAAGTAAAAAMTRAANAAQGAAAAFAGTANASATAATRAAAAQTVAANATNAAAAATNAASAANNNHAASSTRLVAANNAVGGSLSSLTGLWSKLAAIAGGVWITQAMDKYTQLQNTLKISNLSAGEQITMQERLFQSANKNGVAIEDLTQLYRRATISQKSVGASNAEMAIMVDAVSAALRVQGTTARAAAGALLQLSQSFGSGKVKAEEFNSIQEGALPLLDAAAKAIKRYGGDVSKMRADVIAGKLSSKEFFDAIVAGYPELQAAADKTNLTIAAGLTTVSNSWVNLIGKMDEATGASTTIGSALQDVSKWLDKLSKDQDFMDGVKTAFNDLKAIIETTKKEMQLLVKLFEMMKGFGSVIRQNAEASKFAANTAALTEAERQIEIGEQMKQQLENQLKSTTRPQAMQDYKEKIDLVNESLKTQYDIQAKLRSQMSHTSPTDEPTMAPITVVASKLSDDKGGGGGASGIDKKGQKIEDAYQKIILNSQQYIQQQNLERESLGKTAEETDRLKFAMDLLHKMQDAGIPKTRINAEEITKLATAMQQAKNATDAARFAHENTKTTDAFVSAQKVEFEALGMSRQAAAAYRKEHEMLADAKRRNITLGPAETQQIKDNAGAWAAAQEKVTAYRESLEFAKDLAKGFFSDLREGLNNGRTLWESFGSAALNVLNRITDKLVNMAIDELFANAFSTKGSSNGGGGGGNGMSGINAIGNSMGGGGGGGWMSGIGDWIGGMFGKGGGGSPAASAIPHGATSVGSGSSGGFSMANGMGGMGGYVAGGLSILQGGMSLMSNKKPTTKSTIAATGQMVGGALMMIPTGYTQIAGAIIMAASSIIGAMGDTPPTIMNQEYGQLHYGPKGFTTSGGAWGPDAKAENAQGPLNAMGQTMDSVFKAFGGVKDAAKVWGVALETSNTAIGDQSWQSNTSFLVGPNGEKMKWGQNSTDAGLEQAGVASALKSILEGAVGPLTDNMRKGLSMVNQSGKDTFDTLVKAVNELNMFDATLKRLGTTWTTTDEALEKIDESFKELYGTVDKFGLDKGQVDVKKDAARLQVSKDFIQGIDRALMDPLTLALTELGDERTDLVRNNSALMAVKGHVDQLANIELLYQRRRKEIIDQHNAEAIAAEKARVEAMKRIGQTLDDYIKQFMPGGNLAGESAAAHLAGLQAIYDESRVAAQAKPTDEEAIAKFVEAGTNLGAFSKDFFGNNKKFVAHRDQLIADAQLQQSISGGQPTQAASTTTSGNANTSNQFNQLMSTVSQLTDQLAASDRRNAELMQLLERYVSQG
jgi:tape measure domain-containing protein